jgi:hypothetical protein
MPREMITVQPDRPHTEWFDAVAYDDGLYRLNIMLRPARLRTKNLRNLLIRVGNFVFSIQRIRRRKGPGVGPRVPMRLVLRKEFRCARFPDE